MKKSILTILALCFMSFTSSADSVWEECELTCSGKCKQYAKDIKTKADNLLQVCGSDKSEIIDACKKVGFKTYEEDLKCIKVAGSAEAVRACDKVMNTYKLTIDCIANVGEKRSDIIEACYKAFQRYDQINTCIANASDPDMVKMCDTGFKTYEQTLECISSK